MLSISIMENKNNIDTTEPIDFSELLWDYEDEWVVISRDKTKVLAHAKEFEDIEKYLLEGISLKVPKFEAAFIP